MERGQLILEFLVECRCGNWEMLDGANKREASRCAKVFGWIYTQKLGWVCPKCQKIIDRLESFHDITKNSPEETSEKS